MHFICTEGYGTEMASMKLIQYTNKLCLEVFVINGTFIQS